MSISSRITEMEQHIGNAYDKIEDLGIDLTDVDKNINNIATMLENVWNEYPKVTATDVEEASLNGTKKGRINIDLKGNTEQEQLTGKNLLDLSKCTVKNGTLNSDNSITSNIIDGYYTQINTTSLNDYLLTHKGQSITFSIDKVLNNRLISIVIYGQRENSTYQDVSVSNSKTVTLTIANDFISIDNLELRVNRSNTKFTDTTTTVSQIMLEEGTTATDYEPYCGGIPAPNPEFPQQIKNVTGNSNVKIQNKNFLIPEQVVEDSNKPDKVYIENGYIHFITAGNPIVLKPKNIKQNTAYTYVLKCKSKSATSNLIRFIAYYDDGTNAQLSNTTTTSTNEFTTVFTTNANKTLLNVKSGYTNSVHSDIIIDGSMILEGSYTAETIPSYVPHQEQNYPFSLKSKNLVNISTLEKGYVSATGIITVNDTMGERYSKFIKVKPDTNYIFSIIETSSTYDNWFGVGEYSSNNYSSFIRRDTMTTASQSYIQFTTSNTTEYIVVSARNLKDATKIQLEEGSTATDYEPYYEYELCKIDTAQDYFYKQNDKWYKHEEILKTVFDGSNDEIWCVESWGNYHRCSTSIPEAKIYDASNDYAGYSNNFYKSQNVLNSSTISLGEYIQYRNTTSFYFASDKNNENEFKAWLAEHNTEVYCVKATPTDIEITDTTLINQLEAIKQAQGYNDQTNISQTNDELPFILDIEALKGGN